MTTLTATASTSATPIQSRCDCQLLRRPMAERVPSPPQPVRLESDDGTEPAASIEDLRVLVAFRIVLTILGVMALAAVFVAFAVLSPHLRMLGFCVALLMMSFIGLPLILASIADASAAHR